MTNPAGHTTSGVRPHRSLSAGMPTWPEQESAGDEVDEPHRQFLSWSVVERVVAHGLVPPAAFR
jgi:hypothetical protein